MMRLRSRREGAAAGEQTSATVSTVMHYPGSDRQTAAIGGIYHCQPSLERDSCLFSLQIVNVQTTRVFIHTSLSLTW